MSLLHVLPGSVSKEDHIAFSPKCVAWFSLYRRPHYMSPLHVLPSSVSKEDPTTCLPYIIMLPGSVSIRGLTTWLP